MIINSHIGYFNNALLSVKSCNKLYIIIINSYAGQREFFKKANIISFLSIICIFTLIQEKIAAHYANRAMAGGYSDFGFNCL